jgi:formylglycine-generating enzyme required for sulfatase activity
MHGNVWTWCQESYEHFRRGKMMSFEDNEEKEAVLGETQRMQRGGAFDSSPAYLRCAYFGLQNPAVPNDMTGFRLARTCESKAHLPAGAK